MNLDSIRHKICDTGEKEILLIRKYGDAKFSNSEIGATQWDFYRAWHDFLKQNNITEDMDEAATVNLLKVKL